MKPVAMPTAVTPAVNTVKSGEICRVTGEISLLALAARLTMCALFVMAPGCPPGPPAAVGLASRPGRHRRAKAPGGLSRKNDARIRLAADGRGRTPRLWLRHGDYGPGRHAQAAAAC